MPTHKPFLDPWPWLGHSDEEGQMVVVGIGMPGLTPLPIAGWLALGYEALVSVIHPHIQYQ